MRIVTTLIVLVIVLFFLLPILSGSTITPTSVSATEVGVFVMGILGVVFVAPILMSKFGVPLALVAVLQVGIYLIYAVGIYQLITGRSIKNYE